MKTIVAIVFSLVSLSSISQPSDYQIVEAIEMATGWSADELSNGLAMLERVYSNDMQSAAGRIRWHGKVVETRIDTNLLVKVNVHEDGFEHTENFTSARANSVEESLSAAERKRHREEEKKRLEDEKVKMKLERIEYLTTNMTAAAEELASKKGYPIDLATMLLQHELNTSKTNTVFMTFSNPKN